ncbi:hypothetical protein ONS96_007535 [Cadophora gregata f. sp. sojae]|nr:hypothetical protein ONS96_007535 [Cadophora gregata f. sp. sojae]
MAFTNQPNNAASYPSRLVDYGQSASSGIPSTAPNNETTPTDTDRRASIHSAQAAEKETLKRKRTDINNKARERAQQQLMEAINLEAQKVHKSDAHVFPTHSLQLNSAEELPPTKRGRGRPRVIQQPPKVPTSTPSADSQALYAATIPSGNQRQQLAVTVDSVSSPRFPYQQAQQYYNLPVPQSYQPFINSSSPTTGQDQQDKQSQPIVSETSSTHLTYPQAQQTSFLPAPAVSGESQRCTLLPTSGSPTADFPQQPTFSGSSTLRETSDLPQKDQRGQTATATKSDENQPYPYGPYPSYPESLTPTLDVTPTATPHKTVNESVHFNSPASTVSGGASQSLYSNIQPTYGKLNLGFSDIQAGVRTPQKSFFQQGWGPLGIPDLTPPKHLSASNCPPATTNSNTVTVSPAQQCAPLANHAFDTPTSTRRLPSPMEYRTITEAANKAWAAHGSANPTGSRTTYPPPQDSEDIRHAAGRISHSWDQAKTIYLKIDEATRANQNNANDQAIQEIQTLITFPIDWDLAFYHSEKLAWYYSDNSGQLPTNPYPIQVSFSATGYALSNWFYKQAIYPLPLFAQQPMFPQQAIPDEQTLLVDLWICATDLQIPKLQNLALNELDRVRNVNAEMSLTALNHTYNRTKEGSIMRNYLIWQYANRLSESVIMEPRAKPYYPHEFLQEWVMMLTQMWKSLKGRNDMKVDLNLEDFMVQEKKVAWPF